MIRIIALCVTLAAVALGSPPAHAQSAAENRAKAQSKQALKYYLKGQFEEAAKLYKRAYATHPAAKHLYNIGLCYYKLGRYGLALTFLERFRRKAPAGINPAYLRGSKKRIQEIKRITRLITIRVSEAGANVSVDGRVPVVTPLKGSLRLRNGRHTLLVTKTGFLTTQLTFQVGPGSPSVVSVTMRRWGGAPAARRRLPTPSFDEPGEGGISRPVVQPPPERLPPERLPPERLPPERLPPERRPPLDDPGVKPPPSGVVTPTGTDPSATEPRSVQRNKTWLALGLVGAGLLVAAEGMAWGMWGAYKGGDSASAKWPGYLYYTGHALAGIGAGLAIAGFVMYFMKPKQERAASPSARVTPMLSVGRNGAFGGLGGTF
ncbi:MAG: tetratricopeptide repeat protein [bacterium]